MRNLIAVVFLLLYLPIQGQVMVSGKLLDEQNQPVSNVSVTYKKIGGSAILGFGKTDGKGQFKLEVKVADADSIQLDFNHLSYAKKSVNVVNSTASYTYVLRQESRQIEEVNVENRPIFQRKDTINYKVDAFASSQDRVIADVIKKLPGIQMDGDRILYQGKPIQKYMVNNMDLMEGRYGMINKNLPADAVKNVQVVENDQPIKILDSLVFSDKASLNLELKKFTTTGTGKIGIGATPALWDVNMTPIVLGKTFQMLNSFQTNNTGHDVAKDLRPFYTGGGYFGTNPNIEDGPSYIGLRDVTTPGFDEEKWLDNKIFLWNTNVLQQLKNDVVLKGNLSYYDDTQVRQGFRATRYFTSEESIMNTEDMANNLRTNVLDAGVLIEKNEKNVYLRNSLKYHKRWNSDRGDLLFNDADHIDQHRTYTDEALMNSLSMARFLGKQLVNITSELEYHRTPQRLLVVPGQFMDILHNGEPYDRMGQHVLYKGFRWNNSLGFTRSVRRWRFSPRVGLNYSTNDLDTYIETAKDDATEILGEGYVNDMRNSQLDLSLSLGIGWEKQRWKLDLSTPFMSHYFNAQQQGERALDKVIRTTFNPRMNVTYLMNANNELSASLSAGNKFGGLHDFYNGFIIEQYRSMQRYDARLLRTSNKEAAVRYNFKNTMKANFANLGYSYKQGNRDYIFASQIDALGRVTVDIRDVDSRNDQHELTGGVSRFFSPIKTVVKLSGDLSWSRSDYLVNDVLAKQDITGRNGSLEIINNLSEILSGDYKTTVGQTVSKLAGGMHNRVFFNNHYLNLVIHPGEVHSLHIHNSLYHNNVETQRNQFFLDVGYRYRVKKWKTDIELKAFNLFNNNNYLQQFSTDYELVQSYYELRPRQFLISTQFKF